MLSPRQELILRKVVEAYTATGLPVGSKALAADAEVAAGPSTIRHELAMLEEHGLLAHPHTSAGRVPTDAGHRFYVDRLLGAGDGGALARRDRGLELQLVRREVDEAMRATTETLSQVTNLLAIVSAPPVDTATIRHVEVLALQPQVLMVVVITSTGGVTKRMFRLVDPVDPGLVAWAGAYLEDQLVGMRLGSSAVRRRLEASELAPRERAFLALIGQTLLDVRGESGPEVFVGGAAGLVEGARIEEVEATMRLVELLERRAAVLALVSEALEPQRPVVHVGPEVAGAELHAVSLVGATYGIRSTSLGAVGLVGPLRMDYEKAIRTVRAAAFELSRFVEDVYEDA